MEKEQCTHEEVIRSYDWNQMIPSGKRAAMQGEIYRVYCIEVCKKCEKTVRRYWTEETIAEIHSKHGTCVHRE